MSKTVQTTPTTELSEKSMRTGLLPSFTVRTCKERTALLLQCILIIWHKEMGLQHSTITVPFSSQYNTILTIPKYTVIFTLSNLSYMIFLCHSFMFKLEFWTDYSYFILLRITVIYN